MAENTSFSTVYDSFLSKVTDDMYMELFPDETAAILRDLLLNAIPWFEFPKVDVSDYDLEVSAFNMPLTNEEINIIATYMVVEWMSTQLANVDLVRQKYSGDDFKFTSQAAHMNTLLKMKDSYESKGHHLQRLYKRRSRDKEGKVISTFGQIMEA